MGAGDGIALPALNCFGRDKTSKTPWSGAGTSGTQPLSRSGLKASTGAGGGTSNILSRRPTPASSTLMRGGGPRDPTSTAMRGFGTLTPPNRPTGHGPSGSRGTLGSSASGGGRSTLTPPSRPGRRPTPGASSSSAGSGSLAGTMSTAAAAPAAASTAASQQEGAPGKGESGGKSHKCDKCDGNHPTDSCPWFKKPRDKHPDAKPASEKKMLGMQSGPVEVLRASAARVIRQPGDGSCLFHSLSHGLGDGSTASKLRREIAEFIAANPTLNISDSPLKDWVLWDSGSTVQQYCRKMATGSHWGGGIEMAAVSHLKHVNVFVYQSSGGGYKRISVRVRTRRAYLDRALLGET